MSVTKSDPIPRRKLYQEVADRLRERIERGEFAPGQQLPSERELMALHGVGRPAVREAMLTLERMGMISITHGERARVRKPTAQTVIDQIAETARHMLLTSPDALHHLKEARLSFEVGIVRTAAERRTAADLAHLAQALEAHREAMRKGKGFLEKDMAFHRAIIAIANNPIYDAICQAMLQWLAEFHKDLLRLPGAEDLTITEHTQIYDRIAARDPDGAAQAMTDHLNRANEKYRQFEAPRDITGG